MAEQTKLRLEESYQASLGTISGPQTVLLKHNLIICWKMRRELFQRKIEASERERELFRRNAIEGEWVWSSFL
jgi:hypothetical protein